MLTVISWSFAMCESYIGWNPLESHVDATFTVSGVGKWPQHDRVSLAFVHVFSSKASVMATSYYTIVDFGRSLKQILVGHIMYIKTVQPQCHFQTNNNKIHAIINVLFHGCMMIKLRWIIIIITITALISKCIERDTHRLENHLAMQT